MAALAVGRTLSTAGLGWRVFRDHKDMMMSVQGPQGYDDDWLMSQFQFPRAILLTSNHRSGTKVTVNLGCAMCVVSVFRVCNSLYFQHMYTST